MNYLLFIIKSSIDDFNRNRLRTFLTSLGLLIGVASVVLLVAMGLGLKRYIEQQFQSLGTDLLYIMPGNLQNGGIQTASGIGGISFDDKDVATLKKIGRGTIIMPMFVKFAKIQYGANSKTYEVIASTADIFQGLNLEIEYGLPYKKADADKGAKVMVIGPKVAEKLFNSAANAVGKTVKMEDLSFKIIGVSKSKGGGGFAGPGLDEHAFIPLKSATVFNPTKKYFAIYVKTGNQVDIQTAKTEARNMLLKRYKPDDFSVMEQTEILNTVNSIFAILNSVLISIAAISLIVGGIGIMNIMYVSVAERTHEIGIRRAIGATRKDMLLQFLTESLILSVLGGILGLAVSSLIVLLIQRLFPAYIDPLSVAIAIGVSSTIGLIFGILPARKAAELSPIEAIRYE